MKFGRYLRDSLIPEWRKAYIDYRGLKKVIGVFKDQEQPTTSAVKSASGQHDQHEGDDAITTSNAHGVSGPNSRGKQRSTSSLNAPVPSPSEAGQTEKTLQDAKPATDLATQSLSRTTTLKEKGFGFHPPSSTKSIFKGGSKRSGGRHSPQGGTPVEPSNLDDLLRTLTPSEKLFFEKLDEELKKVVTFYDAHEKEAREQAKVLMEQSRELSGHKKAFKAAFPEKHNAWPGLRNITEMINKHTPAALYVHAPRRRRWLLDGISLEDYDRDAHDYYQAKKKIKKALQEYYRGLELLDNYRILNLTGFGKALKKFEKVTGIMYAQKLYMNEKVEPSKIASGDTLNKLRQEIESVYADRFSKGDRKHARNRLRQEAKSKTHHFSTFRAGLWLGLGLPPLILGIVRTYDLHVRSQVPEWDSLLSIYGLLVIPVVFLFLVGLNLCVWTHARINWVFIFDLDIRTVMDYRQFFELPSFLFMTLCYCFFFSYWLVDSPRVAPHTWPLAWLVFTLVILLNPLPIMQKRSRWWFVRMVGKLVVSGIPRVEFADFWLGDQFCSMAYTIGNFYVFGCAYKEDWKDVSGLCSVANTWVAGFLSALPYAFRCSQCVRRYAESGQKIHLVNAGKYLSMIVVYILYFHWRHQGAGRDRSFVFYCVFATIGSTYLAAWDVLMDWSLLRPKAPYKFLRDELIFHQYVPLYYFAIISNIVLRFTWVFYIPGGGLSLPLRAWIFGVLEALRRWQWNFYRVENEHIGNADRYRVTKEIPLSYTMRPDVDEADDSGDEAPPSAASAVSSRSRNRGLARTSSFDGRRGLEDGTGVHRRGDKSGQQDEH